MSSAQGRSLPLSLPQRLHSDLASFAQRTPAAMLERRMELTPLATVREMAQPQPSWLAVFLKAFALASCRCPELRRAYVAFPWPRLYEHPVNVTAVALEQRLGTEAVQLFHAITSPEQQSLLELDAELEQMSVVNIESVGRWRRLLWLSRLPQSLRRMVWWLGRNVSGAWWTNWFGTQAIITVADHGCVYRRVWSPCPTALSYGPPDGDGSIAVSLTFDPRVVDGGTAALALEEIERVLLSEIMIELRYLERVKAA